MYDAFIDSIGIDPSEREEGPENRGRQKWKGKILDDTRDQCRDLFASFYRTMNASGKGGRSGREKVKRRMFKHLLPSGLFNLDNSVKWWQTRRLIDRPYDKDGKDCANDLVDLFGG